MQNLNTDIVLIWLEHQVFSIWCYKRNNYIWGQHEEDYNFNKFKISKQKEKSISYLGRFLLFIGSIISVVGKTTVEIMELFECTQKVP